MSERVETNRHLPIPYHRPSSCDEDSIMMSSTESSEISNNGTTETSSMTRRRQRSGGTQTTPLNFVNNNITDDSNDSRQTAVDADDDNDDGSHLPLRSAVRHEAQSQRWSKQLRGVFTFALVATVLSSCWFQSKLLPLPDVRILQEEQTASFQLFQSSIRKTLGRVQQQQHNRTPVTWDEFLLMPPTKLELDNYFRFNPPPASQIGRLEPLWTCRNTSRHKKLIYVHMARSATSTLRALFRAYAHYCNAGIAMVSQCVDLATPFMHGNEVWANGAYSSHIEETCKLSSMADRHGNDFPTNRTSTVSTQLLEENEIDILTGFLPLGSNLYWRQTQKQDAAVGDTVVSSKHVDTQCVVFFREPLHKFVSEVLFYKDSQQCCETVDDAVAWIRNIVSSQLELGAYRDKLTRYLITPQQNHWIYNRGISLTKERRVNLTLSNLVHNNVLVGIVEHMSASLQLVRYILDEDYQIKQLFDFFSDAEKIDQANGGELALSNNKTNAIVAAIQQNATLLEMVNEYLKYEQRIYKYALMIHKRQTEWLSSQELKLKVSNLTTEMPHR